MSFDNAELATGAVRFAGGRRSASFWAKLSSNVEPRRLKDLLEKTGPTACRRRRA